MAHRVTPHARRDRSANRTDLHLAELLDFRPDQGIIRLHEQRVVILSAAAMAFFAARGCQSPAFAGDRQRDRVLEFVRADRRSQRPREQFDRSESSRRPVGEPWRPPPADAERAR